MSIYNHSPVIRVPYVDYGRCLRRKVWVQEVSGRVRRCAGYPFPTVSPGRDLDPDLMDFRSIKKTPLYIYILYMNAVFIKPPLHHFFVYIMHIVVRSNVPPKMLDFLFRKKYNFFEKSRRTITSRLFGVRTK